MDRPEYPVPEARTIRRKKIRFTEWTRIQRASIFELHEFLQHEGSGWSQDCKPCADTTELFMGLYFETIDQPAIITSQAGKVTLREFLDMTCDGNVERCGATIGVGPLTIYRWLKMNEDSVRIEVKRRKIRYQLRTLKIMINKATI